MFGHYTTGPRAGCSLPYGLFIVKVFSCSKMGIIISMNRYPIPATERSIENSVLNSRFIATVAPVFSVEEARQFITRIKTNYPDATHHVPAYIIGFGASIISHCNDNGEPSGTAGRPVLAVLSGSGFGDIAIVVTRYFGGTKLGSGGLVRAYSNAARQALIDLPRAEKVTTHTILVAAPYAWYDRLQTLTRTHNGKVLEQDLASDITLTIQIPVDTFPTFQKALSDASNGNLPAIIINTEETIFPTDI
jgi:uncharacterized YigZ family protein